MIARRDVKAPVGSPERLSQQGTITNVSANSLVLNAFESTSITVRAQQRFHPVPAGHQFMNQIGADKTRSARHKTNHKQIRMECWSIGKKVAGSGGNVFCLPSLQYSITPSLHVPPILHYLLAGAIQKNTGHT